ncbi:VOC family protein [Epidermidibacterium keratini]|uniref:VOC family protein n=1 Tax=Epidermidibacterium keratini TaxID=1891644 RepID=A0A7L4YKA9_9ACTN|nr:VOC family protein [Epidermidibacterium keratini]QHB99238.1 VOC family protein [Epidermidibacterium keratini]
MSEPTNPGNTSGAQPPGSAAEFPAPTEGLLVTQFLTVRDVAVSIDFYVRVFGAEVVFEENPATVKLANSWIIMNPGGGPTPDKPDIWLRAPKPTDPVSTFLNMRVADIDAFYQHAKGEGAEFVTEPIDRKAEIRCYLRDPDGYLVEIGQSTGLLEGIHADPPAGSES